VVLLLLLTEGDKLIIFLFPYFPFFCVSFSFPSYDLCFPFSSVSPVSLSFLFFRFPPSLCYFYVILSILSSSRVSFSLFFCSYFFTSLFQARLLSLLSLLRLFSLSFFLMVLRLVFIGQRGAGSTLSSPYHCIWGVGPSCPITAPNEMAHGCGLQGTAPLVSHHEGAWGFRFWQSTWGEREAGRNKEEFFFSTLITKFKTFFFY